MSAALLDVLWYVSAALGGVVLVFVGCLPMAVYEWWSDRRR